MDEKERFKSTAEFNDAEKVFGFSSKDSYVMFGAEGKALSDTTLGVVNTVNQLGSNIDSIKKDFSNFDSKQYDAVGEAIGDAINEYWEHKKEDFKVAWNTTEEVTIGSLVGRVCDLTWGEDSILDDVGDRLALVVGALTGTSVDTNGNAWLSLAENMSSDFLTYVTTDDEVGKKVAEIDAVKGLVKIVKTSTQLKDNIVNILETVEPLIPIAELVWEFASAYSSGGTSLIKATSDLDKQAQQALHKLIVLTLIEIKRLVFSWKIKVPSLLLGSINALTSVETSAPYSTGQKWLDELLNEDYYNQIKSQSKWNENINDAINFINDPLQSVEVEWNNETIKNIFTNRLVTNSLGNLLSSAYANTGINEKEYNDWDEVKDDIMEWYNDIVLPAVDVLRDFASVPIEVRKGIQNGTSGSNDIGGSSGIKVIEMTEEEIVINSRYILNGLI